MFSGLASLVIEDVADDGEVIRVSARTQDEPVPCPGVRAAECSRQVGCTVSTDEKDTALLAELTATCPEITQLASLIREFARFLTPAPGNGKKLTAWIASVRTAQLPYLHGFTNGLELDRAAVDAGLTLPHHNGRTEGVNTRTKRIMRQMHGRAGFDLLRHRILLH